MLRENHISVTEFAEGYLPSDVNAVLSTLQFFIEKKNIEGKLCIIWDTQDELMGVDGNSSLWMITEETKTRGVEIATPLIEKNGIDAFIRDIQAYQQGRMDLEPLQIKPYNEYNYFMN